MRYIIQFDIVPASKTQEKLIVASLKKMMKSKKTYLSRLQCKNKVEVTSFYTEHKKSKYGVVTGNAIQYVKGNLHVVRVQ